MKLVNTLNTYFDILTSRIFFFLPVELPARDGLKKLWGE